MDSWQEVASLSKEDLMQAMAEHMYLILAPGALGSLPWEFVIVAAAQLEFEAARVLFIWDVWPRAWKDFQRDMSLGRAAEALKVKGVFPPTNDVVECLERIADLRNSLVHGQAAQHGVQGVKYLGGEPFEDLDTLKLLVWDYDRTKKKLRAMFDWLHEAKPTVSAAP